MTVQKDIITAEHFQTTLDATVYYTLKDILSKLDAVLEADATLDVNLTKASVILAFVPVEDSDRMDSRARWQSWTDWAVLQEAIRELDAAAYRALPDEAEAYRLEHDVLDQLGRKGRTR